MATPRTRGAPAGSLRWLCWLPLACLVAAEAYVHGFDGWGAWAAAPLLLVPGILSLAIVVPAAFECAVALRAGSLRPDTVLFTAIAGLPLAWLGVRRFFL